jgi:Anticodon-binding domain
MFRQLPELPPTACTCLCCGSCRAVRRWRCVQVMEKGMRSIGQGVTEGRYTCLRNLICMQIMEKDMRSIGKGVTSDAQDVFDALEKTMPCAWADQKIHVRFCLFCLRLVTLSQDARHSRLRQPHLHRTVAGVRRDQGRDAIRNGRLQPEMIILTIHAPCRCTARSRSCHRTA